MAMRRVVDTLLRGGLRRTCTASIHSSSSSLSLSLRPFSSQKPPQSKSAGPTGDKNILEMKGKTKDETKKILSEKCGVDGEEDEEEEEMEEMFVMGPAGVEWGGPTRGGQRPEPTRFGDWERKGRTSDF